MDASPNVPPHSFLKELNWSGALRGVPKDGDVKSNSDTLTGLKSYSLRAHPRAGHICGLSFFAPSPELSERTHQYLGKNVFGCGMASSSVSLPPNLRLLNDIHLLLPLDGDNLQTINCGEHWVLYTTADMPVDEFHAYCTDLMKASIPCNMDGGAEPFNATTFLEELGVDMDLMPGDRHSYISVMALDELVANTDNDNVRLFASLFSLHERATNMNFDDILKCGPIANMVSTALDVWTARDPFIVGPAQEAQHLLAGVLGFQPKGIVYKPFWPCSINLVAVGSRRVHWPSQEQADDVVMTVPCGLDQRFDQVLGVLGVRISVYRQIDRLSFRPNDANPVFSSRGLISQNTSTTLVLNHLIH
ncbi:hypothetical protein CEUSTIGMA_g14100.t1 [Chlamydomonas eustigma]|uniref:Uncharacterized protein n=1 Tax=Chlamydomonas eustigma TaxID=1157962 RepID=A0A250XUI5_9CHLO|nr:hypothetical protein CEUSTIGMA_g14100.t1 [Chlamydomonas eustigma]|eukprot:GAX86693.1 hypothetical protein CEUSTIGMA_g14100.t1 [Chlamydomonas eustigma]